MILLLLAVATSDPDLLLANARARLSASCAEAGCATSPAGARFRIDDGQAIMLTAKDRAIRDDGSKCNVVGARRCPKRGRTIFRTDLGR